MISRRFTRGSRTTKRLRWAAAGAGRLLASPTVFEDVVKTICTTNCVWAATVRMTAALVERGGGAFPEPALLAKTPECVVSRRRQDGISRALYQADRSRRRGRPVGPRGVLPGRGSTTTRSKSNLRELPGIGPYAAAHVMQLSGGTNAWSSIRGPGPRICASPERSAPKDSSDRARLCAIRRLCRSCVLAVRHPQLARRVTRASGSLTEDSREACALPLAPSKEIQLDAVVEEDPRSPISGCAFAVERGRPARPAALPAVSSIAPLKRRWPA